MADEMESNRRSVAPRVSMGLGQIDALYRNALALIDSARAIALKPGAKKEVHRKLSVAEVCKLLNIHHSVLYGPNSPLPPGEKTGTSRVFTVEEFHSIQAKLGLTPRVLYGIKRAVKLAVANFKGGVGKTSEAVGLAQDCALHGYRTLLIDFDPQGSTTSLMGFRPYADVSDWDTILPFIYGEARCTGVYEEAKAAAEAKNELFDDKPYWTGTLRSAIQKTYWPSLDLVPANLSVYLADIMIGVRDKTEAEFRWYEAIAEAIETVAADYDVIVFDLPPQLSLYTGSAVYAADALIIPTPASQMDLESTLAFLRMLKELFVLAYKQIARDLGIEVKLDEVLEEDYAQALEDLLPPEHRKNYESFRVLVTKYQSGIRSQSRLFGWIRAAFGESMVPEPMPFMQVVQDLAPELQTIFEHGPRARNEPKAAPGEPFKASKAQLRDALNEAGAVHHTVFDDLVDIFRARQAAERFSEGVAPTRPSIAASRAA